MLLGISNFPDVVPDSSRLSIRWIFLLGILAFELIGLIDQLEAPTVVDDARWSAWLFANSTEIWQTGFWSAGFFLLNATPRFQAILGDLRLQSSGYGWTGWLVCHLLAFIAFVVITLVVFEKPTDPTRLSATWFAAWFTLGTATFMLWLLALAPARFWLQLVRQEYSGLIMGVVLGIGISILIGMLVRQEAPLAQKELWSALSSLTLQLVYPVLGWFYSDLVYTPEMSVVGTADFQVTISYACSGVEGISLITLFLTGYLWLFRNTLRFPQAFWLFPFGIIAIWLANIIRIAALVVIGASFSPKVAIEGFHAHAGWIAFTLIAFSVIVLSHRLWLLPINLPSRPAMSNSGSLAIALLVPVMVLIATSMVAATFSADFEWLYPLQAMAVAMALWHYRKAYAALGWGWSWQAVAGGGVVFLLWMLLEPRTDDQQTELAMGIARLSTEWAAVWLAFRVFGSVILTPLAEELAFRGYLLRKLIAADFERVRSDQLTWISLIVSSVLFGLLHGERWLAGTLAGMVYALVLSRRGQLGDAVLAHVTTNGFIAIWVLIQGRWALWS